MNIALTYNSSDGKVFRHWPRASHEHLKPDRVDEVLDALRTLGHRAEAFDADLRLASGLCDFFGPDRKRTPFPGLVLNLAYGIQGESRYSHIPSLLEMIGLPYVGSGPLAQSLASDKLTSKRLFRACGLATAEFTVYEDLKRGPEHRDGPTLRPAPEHAVVVKPAGEAASEGLRLINDPDQLVSAIRDDLTEFGPPILVERFLPGREINVAILGDDPITTLPTVEVIVEGSPLYDAAAKHSINGCHLISPAPMSPELEATAHELAVGAFQVLRCRDWARVDMRLDEAGRLYILEVNTIPALGPHSSFRKAAEAAGLDGLKGALEAVIESARKRIEREATASVTR